MLNDAIQSIDVGRRTAIGSGILKSIDAIAEINKNIAPSDASTTSTSVPPMPVPKGAYAPAIIIVLTDGVSNVGPLPTDAAQQAADRGIRVYTIGFGTASNESIPQCGRGFQGGGNAFGNGNNAFGGGGNFGGFRRGIDEDTLKQVADLTGGAYYPAESASELQHVFKNLPVSLIVQHETMEISVIFTALGALLAILAIGLSFAWHPLT
jgi:Ca-activated chloride channel family protein